VGFAAVPALLNLQPGGALLLGGLILLVAGLVLLWLARAQMPSEAIRASSTPLPTPLMFTLTPLLIEEPVMVSQPAAVLDAPRCYDTPSNDLMCLGLLRNSTDHLWKTISISAQLATKSQRVMLEQTYLLPGHSAPYRVLWPSDEVHEEDADVLIAAPHAQSVTDTVIEIPVQEIGGLWLGQTRYQVRGILQNFTDLTLNHGQIIVTLLDEEGAVVGYRLSDLSPLSAGASAPISIDLVPLIYNPNLTPQITALAWTE
jgi:hypothetical protein